MQSSPAEITPILGTAMDGGHYAGRILIDGQAYALIVAPKDGGERDDIEWSDNTRNVPAAMSFCDGHANTLAMAEAGSPLAQWARGLRIAGHDDWYLPSQDELEVLYRNLKPTPRANYCWARSGINLSAIAPTRPYAPDHPVQTSAEVFQADGAEAFEEDAYWTSTQYAADADYAWYQYFDNGLQGDGGKGAQLRARAVRRLPI